MSSQRVTAHDTGTRKRFAAVTVADCAAIRDANAWWAFRRIVRTTRRSIRDAHVWLIFATVVVGATDVRLLCATEPGRSYGLAADGCRENCERQQCQ